MALSANTVFEVRTTGSDTNGGGFVTGASGTDWSQQNSAQYSVTDGVTNGTTTITSATANFGTDVVGNIIYVQGGTGSVTEGWYEITARNSATSITVDRATGLTAGTGVTLKIGGAFASPGRLTGVFTNGNVAFIKYSATPYSFSTTTAGPSGPVSCSFTDSYGVFCGYDTTRSLRNTDANRPTLKATVSGVTFFGEAVGYSCAYFQNLIFDCNNQTSCTAFGSSYVPWHAWRCKFTNFASQTGCFQLATYCEAVNCGTGFGGISFGCTATGCTYGFSGVTNHCIAYSNTIGFVCPGFGANYIHSNAIAYGNSSHGFQDGNSSSFVLTNCLSVSNGGYGFALGNRAGISELTNCATYGNTSGSITGLSSTAMQSTGTVTLSANPFTNAAGGDFSLNNTAGGGAACRAAGFPGAFPGGTTTGYLDIGAVQHQDSGGGGGMGVLIGSGGLIR